MVKKLVGQVTIIEKEFTDKNGNSIKYISAEVCIDGEVISLVPKASDKKLFNYLLKKEGIKTSNDDFDVPDVDDDKEV
jgi:hypothetical protein